MQKIGHWGVVSETRQYAAQKRSTISLQSAPTPSDRTSPPTDIAFLERSILPEADPSCRSECSQNRKVQNALPTAPGLDEAVAWINACQRETSSAAKALCIGNYVIDHFYQGVDSAGAKAPRKSTSLKALQKRLSNGKRTLSAVTLGSYIRVATQERTLRTEEHSQAFDCPQSVLHLRPKPVPVHMLRARRQQSPLLDYGPDSGLGPRGDRRGAVEQLAAVALVGFAHNSSKPELFRNLAKPFGDDR